MSYASGTTERLCENVCDRSRMYTSIEPAEPSRDGLARHILVTGIGVVLRYRRRKGETLAGYERPRSRRWAALQG
jgi:hypothetical protein